MRELTEVEIEEVNGALLANLGMGIGGAMAAIGTYSITTGINGNMTGTGFVGAAVGGFIWGAGGFNHVSGTIGAATGAGVERWLSSSHGISARD